MCLFPIFILTGLDRVVGGRLHLMVFGVHPHALQAMLDGVGFHPWGGEVLPSKTPGAEARPSAKITS